MNLTFHCCEEWDVRKMNCCQNGLCGGDGDEKENSEILFNNIEKSIYVLSTPETYLNNLFGKSNIQDVDMYLVYNDKERNICISNFEGKFTDIETKEDELRGKKIKDILPDHNVEFLDSIYSKMLEGKHMQIVINWNSKPFLFRGFPIFDHKKKCIAGLVNMLPYTTQSISTNVENYVLNRDSSKINKLRKSRHSGMVSSRPAKQSMEK